MMRRGRWFDLIEDGTDMDLLKNILLNLIHPFSELFSDIIVWLKIFKYSELVGLIVSK